MPLPEAVAAVALLVAFLPLVARVAAAVTLRGERLFLFVTEDDDVEVALRFAAGIVFLLPALPSRAADAGAFPFPFLPLAFLFPLADGDEESSDDHTGPKRLSSP